MLRATTNAVRRQVCKAPGAVQGVQGVQATQTGARFFTETVPLQQPAKKVCWVEGGGVEDIFCVVRFNYIINDHR